MEAFCDNNGVCKPADLENEKTTNPLFSDSAIVYVGDPMCSWCWGISNHLSDLRKYYIERGLDFEIIVGGLRPGGGDPWNDQMKSFLQHHWHEVNKRSGQPFGSKLFDLEYFNYDTEPSCRAVVASRELISNEADELKFFEAIQRKFYVENEDTTLVDFYKSICEEFGIDFQEFKQAFENEDSKYRTKQEFQVNRQWGVKGYPTVILKVKDQLYLVAHGYAEFDEMKERIEKIFVQLATEETSSITQ